MKVYYKSIIQDDSNLVSRVEYTRYEYCCDEMKKLDEDGDHLNFEIDWETKQLELRLCFRDNCEGHDEYSFKLCPFCGKPVEFIEEKRVRYKRVEKRVSRMITETIEEEIK